MRGELFELLDGRWPTDLKNDSDDDESVETVAQNTERLSGEKLRNATFFVGAGTFQQFYDGLDAEQKPIGFNSSASSATKPVNLSATASDSRSQSMNRQFALERLLDLFEKQRAEKKQERLAAVSKARRQKAKRSRSTKRKLVEGKRKRGETKKLRGRISA